MQAREQGGRQGKREAGMERGKKRQTEGGRQSKQRGERQIREAEVQAADLDRLETDPLKQREPWLHHTWASSWVLRPPRVLRTEPGHGFKQSRLTEKTVGRKKHFPFTLRDAEFSLLFPVALAASILHGCHGGSPHKCPAGNLGTISPPSLSSSHLSSH